MSSARVRALLLFFIAAAAAIAFQFSGTGRHHELQERPSGHRPSLLFLTSLPLLFGDTFSLGDTGSVAVRRLQTRYQLVPISVTDASELKKGRILLMAQPQAQTAENLVALDAWVRGGGRLLLLADPLLEWPSSRPLSDVTRPPAMFADTGLLKHWGLRLDRPEKPGAALRSLGGLQIMTVSPGSLYGTCKISPDRLVAHCSLGRGRATIVADADLLDVAELGPGARYNFDGLFQELESLEQP